MTVSSNVGVNSKVTLRSLPNYEKVGNLKPTRDFSNDKICTKISSSQIKSLTVDFVDNQPESVSSSYGQVIALVKTSNLSVKQACKSLKLDEKLTQLITNIQDFKQWSSLKGLSANDLANNLEAQIKLYNLAQSTNQKQMQEISSLLKVDIKGAPKNIDRIIDKLQKTESSVGNLKDISRARIDLESLNLQEMKAFKELIIKKYKLSEANVSDLTGIIDKFDKDYKGRIHFSLTSKNGMLFELQMGPKQLSKYNDTTFKIMGVEQDFHEAFYKGVFSYLKTPENGADYQKALNYFGKGDPIKGKKVIEESLKAVGDGDVESGRKILQDLVNLQRTNLAEVINLAQKGEDFDFYKQNEEVINQLNVVFKKIPKSHLPPVFLDKLKEVSVGTKVLAPQALKQISSLNLNTANKTFLAGLQNKVSTQTMENISTALAKAEKNTELKELVFKVLKTSAPESLDKAFAKDFDGEALLKLTKKLKSNFESYGMNGVSASAKASKTIFKVLPLVGGSVSALDAARLKSISEEGQDPISGKKYKDPQVRALAKVGFLLNTMDSSVALLDILEIKNLNLPANLLLAASTISIDLLLDHFEDNPSKMPSAMRNILKNF